MASRTPLYAGIPHSTLSCAASTSSSRSQKTVDALLDDLDSDSGFSDEGRPEPSSAPVAEAATPLQNAPSLFPDTSAGKSASSESPPWLRWTSSRVTCSDAVYGSNEDKIDCVWLVLGCLDGSVWIFCALIAQRAAGTTTPARHAGLRSNSQPNLLQSLAARPAMSRKPSDLGNTKRGMPPSPIAGSSRFGTSSVNPSRAGSTVPSHSHTRKNRSISLAFQNAVGLGGSSSAPRKASATISTSDFDAAGNESLNKDLPSPPKSPTAPYSPSIHGSERPSFSFEELPQLNKVDYAKLTFEPITRIHLDALHAPVRSVKILPTEGATIPFVCLTEDGHLYKLSCVDGTLLARSDLRCALFPRASAVSFGPIVTVPAEPSRLFCATDASKLLVVNSKDLAVLPTLSVQPGHVCTVAESSNGVQLLAMRNDGHLIVSPLAIDKQMRFSSEASDAGPVFEDDEQALGIVCSGINIIVWSSAAVKICRLMGQNIQVLHSIDNNSSALQDVVLLSAARIALIGKNSVRIAAVENREHQHVVLYLKLSETVLSASVFAQPATTDDCLVIVTEDSDGSRSICLTPLDDESSAESSEPDVLVAYSAAPASHKYAPAVTASASLAGGRLIIGDTLGSLSLLDIETDTASSLEDSGTERASPITCILPCEDAHGDVKIYAGTTDGQVSCWQIPASEPAISASHDLFSCPVTTLLRVEQSVLAVSADGTMALMKQDGDTMVLPGSRSPIERLYMRQSQLLVVFTHGLARLWDIEGGMMQKSMDHSGVESLLAHMDGWQDIPIDSHFSKPAQSLDLRVLIEAAAAATAKGSKMAEERLNPMIRWLVPYYCPRPTENYVLKALESLGIVLLDHAACSANAYTVAVYPSASPLSSYTISKKVTARRLLTLVSLLRIFLNFADTERAANEAIAYYSTQLVDLVGPALRDASLDHLADFWLDESNEIRQAARLLFGARIGRLEEAEVMLEVQERQAMLLQATSIDAKELLILGEIAIARYDLLTNGTIRDIGYNIAGCLHSSDNPAAQNVSLELCIRGFNTFQNSFDAVKVLRSIFRLATSSSTDPTAIGLRNLARQAVLTVAATNAPLFMTVLSFDAVHDDADSDERDRTMKLVAFMVRKKPIVLFASLPRLAEMVVRSLDPRGNLRGVLQQTATFILSKLVKTYPSIAFHGKSQRLAVGTHEGAVVVYDLKTATRLYILESHHKRASAVSYSPDGRRLVTVSLEESNVKVWKVGASLLGLLTPAGPPPQGHGASSNEAYKTLDFKLASPEEAMMTAAAQLEWLTVDWQDDRRVKLTIRETALTFSVA